MRLKDLLAIADSASPIEVRIKIFERTFCCTMFSDSEIKEELKEKEVERMGVFENNNVPTIWVWLK